jgi:hypothetical protein
VDVDYSPNYYPEKISIIDTRIISLAITRTDKPSVEKKPPINQNEIDIPGSNHVIIIIQVMLPYSPNINDTVSAFIREHPDNPTLRQFEAYLYNKNEYQTILGEKYHVVNDEMVIDDPSVSALQLSIITSLDKPSGTELEVPSGGLGPFNLIPISANLLSAYARPRDVAARHFHMAKVKISE